jgi:hypothetical protein
MGKILALVFLFVLGFWISVLISVIERKERK